ncbi:MAG TPA: OmpA family protein [Bryobacteraceae bacterium]|nr:OmpA family protein [Bryobacteraceae bacterium]
MRPRRERRSTLASLIAIAPVLVLLVLAAGCKKKAPPPPPPPPPPANETRPTTVGKPVINSFSAEPTTVQRGQGSTLRWSISNSTDMNIDQGIGPVQSQGSRQVFPTNTTTYTLVANGPGGSDTRSVTVEVASAPPPPPPPPTAPTVTGTEMLSREGQDAFFDYDKSDIRPDARDALTHDADLLKRIFQQEPNMTIMVEGHCDERGSAEYNLALGDRRATAAKDFLVQLGVPAEKLRTISYGKERPQCTDASEECYQKNRRAHLGVAQ